VLNNQLPIDGKVFDIDKVVEQGVNAYRKIEYGDSNFFSKTKLNNFAKVYRKQIAPQIMNSMRRLFFNKEVRTTLDNVIFLNCGNKNDTLVHGIISQAKEFGYKICIIFVAANRSVALGRNLQRSRVVADKAFHSRCERAANFINEFLTKNTYPEVDTAYLILSSGPNLNVANDDNNVIKLEKTENGFILPINNNKMKPNNQFIQTIDDLKGFLGKKETFKDLNGKEKMSPQTYLSAAEIRRNNMQPNSDGTYLREMALRRKIKSMVIESLKKLK
jgi:hypothetical protein